MDKKEREKLLSSIPEPGKIVKASKKERTFMSEDIRTVLESLDKIVDIYTQVVGSITSIPPMIVRDEVILNPDDFKDLLKPITTNED